MRLYRRVLSAVKEQITAIIPSDCVSAFSQYRNEMTLSRLAAVAVVSGFVQILWMLMYIFGGAGRMLPQLLAVGFVYVAFMAGLNIWVHRIGHTENISDRLTTIAVSAFLLVYLSLECIILYVEVTWVHSIARLFVALMGLTFAPLFYARLQVGVLGVYLVAATGIVLTSPQISSSTLLYMYPFAFFLWGISRKSCAAYINRFVAELQKRRMQGELQNTHSEAEQPLHLLTNACIAQGAEVVAMRRAYDEYLSRIWEQCAEYDSPVTVVLVQIDRFLDLKQSLGQDKIEKYTSQVGQHLRRIAQRSTDMVATGNFGQFYVLLPYLPDGATAKIAQRMCAGVEGLQIPYPADGYVTVSIGFVNRRPSSGLSAEALMELCARVLRKAEREGGNRVVGDWDGELPCLAIEGGEDRSILAPQMTCARMQSIINKMAKCSFVYDLATGRIEFTEQVMYFTGSTKTEYDNVSELLSFVYSEDQPSVLQSVQDYLESDDDNTPVVFRVRDIHGEYKWAKLLLSYVCDREGTPYQIVGIIDDADREMYRYQVYDLITEGAISCLFSYTFKPKTFWVNEAFRLLLGLGKDADKDRLRKKVNAEDWDELVDQIYKLAPKTNDRLSMEVRAFDAMDRPLWLSVRAKAAWDAGGRLYLLAGAVTDVTEQAMARQMNRLIVEGSSDCVYTLDMVNGRMEFSPKITEMTMLTQTILEDGMDRWIQLIVQEDRDRFLNAMDAIYRGLTDEYAAEFRLRGKEEPVWVACRGKVSRDENGTPIFLAGSILNIEGMWQYNRFMEEQALTDRVTGLPNRVSFYRDMGARLRTGEQGYVVLMDLDDFKNLNSMHGHSMGDKVLRRFGVVIHEALPPQGQLYHLGGDLFAVDFHGFNLEQIKRWMISIYARHNNGIIVENAECYLTFSMGAVLYNDGSTVDELLSDADIAVNKVKRQGKAGYTLFDPNDRVGYLQKLEMEGILRRCVENGMVGFELFYQPLVKAETLECVGAEALLRWRRSEDEEVLPPATIIPALEKIGLMPQVENWVVREGLAACRRWIEQGAPDDFVMSINLTPVQITRRTLPGDVIRMIQQNRLHPSNLTLEITEASCVLEMQSGIGTLSALRASGIGIAIDDFGTGYSSLSYLRELEVDEVKIDRSFIRDIVNSSDGRSFVQSIIQLSHNIGHTVCVEGVETMEQARMLNILRADILQGYHFGRPMPEQDFIRRFIDCNG